MLAARILCLISAAVCILVGIWSSAAPEGVAQMIGLDFRSVAGRIEFVTVYGGFYLGIGLFLIVAALWRRWLEAGLAMSTLGASGALLARFAGYVTLAPEAGITVSLLISEVAWVAASAVGWRLAATRA
jgi:hypothetical protein